MVCPDAINFGAPPGGWPRTIARCIKLAGVSPALVITGEPGSRLQPWGEIPPAERSVESPTVAVRSSGGEQICGPSIKRTLQPRDIGPRKGGIGRAGHVAAKATDCIRRSGGMQDVPGVGRRARRESLIRNRRGPHWLPTSGEGVAYKWNTKWQRARRESEGFIVPLILGESRAEGRDPAFVALVCGGKGEGMA